VHGQVNLIIQKGLVETARKNSLHTHGIEGSRQIQITFTFNTNQFSLCSVMVEQRFYPVGLP
jgi:hypothetical protein